MYWFILFLVLLLALNVSHDNHIVWEILKKNMKSNQMCKINGYKLKQKFNNINLIAFFL